MIDLIILAISIIVLVGYYRLKRCFLYWENHNVPHLKPESLIFGNAYDMIAEGSSVAEFGLKVYNALRPYRFGGVYNFCKPALYVRDPELIKNILIKDFQHFSDRSFHLARKEEPLSLQLLLLHGKEWQILRHKLSPTFTSNKIKKFFNLVKECAEKMEEILEKSAMNHEIVDVQDVMVRYTTDVISSCAFGLEADSLRDPESKFLQHGKNVITPSFRMRLMMLLFTVCPTLIPILRLRMFPQETSEFFIKLVSNTIEYRKKNGIVRDDFLNLLMKLQEEETGKANDIAQNKGVQKRLQEEVDLVLENHNGHITYEAVQEMRYMEQVFSETSRRFPALPIIFRVCTKDYRMPDSDYVVKRGETVFIPVYGIHNDPQYYPDPDVFNPENFSEDAKASRPNCCFLPFGDGPRNCIAKRFGIMQVKLALSVIMRQYTVTIAPEMKLPVKLAPYTFPTSPESKILLNFTKRNLVKIER